MHEKCNSFKSNLEKPINEILRELGHIWADENAIEFSSAIYYYMAHDIIKCLND